MTDLALFTGFAGEEITINVVFSDHNNVRHNIPIELKVHEFDKPRMLDIIVDGKHVATFNSQKKTMTFHR